MKWMVIWAFTFFSSLALAQSPVKNLESIYRNNHALMWLKDKNFRQGQAELLEALRLNPSNHWARLNLGVSFVLAGDLEKAVREFQQILNSPGADQEVLFLTWYNLGRAHQERQKISEALVAYQKALEYQPDSLQTKTNIELLLQNPSGGGQGEGESDPQEGDQENQPPQGGQEPKEQQEPQKSPQDLSEKDIEKILEELKNQEQKIRALEFGKPVKENPSGKSW